VLYGGLLDKNSYRCESLTDLSYPVVVLQGSQSSSDGFIERLRGDLYGVLNVSNVLYRNCARSENHTLDRSIFAFCSLQIAAGSQRFPDVTERYAFRTFEASKATSGRYHLTILHPVLSH
jgi:hypothetical protein